MGELQVRGAASPPPPPPGSRQNEKTEEKAAAINIKTETVVFEIPKGGRRPGRKPLSRV